LLPPLQLSPTLTACCRPAVQLSGLQQRALGIMPSRAAKNRADARIAAPMNAASRCTAPRSSLRLPFALAWPLCACDSAAKNLKLQVCFISEKKVREQICEGDAKSSEGERDSSRGVDIWTDRRLIPIIYLIHVTPARLASPDRGSSLQRPLYRRLCRLSCSGSHYTLVAAACAKHLA
jgi:hypothetical protein